MEWQVRWSQKKALGRDLSWYYGRDLSWYYDEEKQAPFLWGLGGRGMQHSKQNEQYVPTVSWKHVGRTERRQVWLKDSEPKKQKGSGGEGREGRKSTRQCRTFILQVIGNHWRKVFFSRGVIPFKIFSKCLFIFCWTGPSMLHTGFLQLQGAGATLQV